MSRNIANLAVEYKIDNYIDWENVNFSTVFLTEETCYNFFLNKEWILDATTKCHLSMGKRLRRFCSEIYEAGLADNIFVYLHLRGYLQFSTDEFPNRVTHLYTHDKETPLYHISYGYEEQFVIIKKEEKERLKLAKLYRSLMKQKKFEENEKNKKLVED